MNLTLTARSGIRDLGMAQADALAVVHQLNREHFYKSTTTLADHRTWQGVYHGVFEGTALRIKFQRAGDYFIVSFKEL